jgi:hypothetical protein
MNFKKWVKSIQTAGYNGARTVIDLINSHKNSLGKANLTFPTSCTTSLQQCRLWISERKFVKSVTCPCMNSCPNEHFSCCLVSKCGTFGIWVQAPRVYHWARQICFLDNDLRHRRQRAYGYMGVKMVMNIVYLYVLHINLLSYCWNC